MFKLIKILNLFWQIGKISYILKCYISYVSKQTWATKYVFCNSERLIKKKNESCSHEI